MKFGLVAKHRGIWPVRWRTEPEVDRRLHLRLDGRGMAVCGGGDRPVLASRRRLGDARHHGGRASHRRIADGDLAARPAGCPAESFRPGEPIQQRTVPEAHGGSRRMMQHEPVGQRLGQRRDGKLLLIAENRAHGTQGLSDQGPGPCRRVRLHRAVLQPATTPFDYRLRQPYGVRENGRDGLRLVSTEPAAAQ